jgi:AraC-like DNA-binding protein
VLSYGLAGEPYEIPEGSRQSTRRPIEVLMGRGYTEVGKADLRWAVAFVPRLWCSAFVQRGLVVDTRLVAASEDAPRPAGCLYLVLKGTFVTHGRVEERFDAPAAFVVSDDQLDGSSGSRPFTFSAVGNPYAAVELHLEMRDMRVLPAATPPRLTLDERAWQAARELGRLAEIDDEAFQAAVERLLESLVALGHVAPAIAERMLEPTPKAFALLWRALRPMVERLYLTPTLKEVGEATGMSTRQVDRHVQDFVTSFAFVGEGWRPATRYLRLKFAAILLSAEGVSVAEVARVVGYRSSDAMSRAFRDAKMMAPTQIQEEARRAGALLASPPSDRS